MKFLEIAARGLHRHLGGGVRENYNTVNSQVLSVLKDGNGQDTAITFCKDIVKSM